MKVCVFSFSTQSGKLPIGSEKNVFRQTMLLNHLRSLINKTALVFRNTLFLELKFVQAGKALV